MDLGNNYWTRRPASRRNFLKGVGTGGGALGLMLLVGCGDDDDTPSVTATAAGTQAAGATGTAAPATATPDARYSDRNLRVGATEGQPHASPRNSTVAADAYPFSLLGDWYLYIGGDGKLKIEESLFESYEFSDDTTLVAKLRPGVTFHDGTPFTATEAKAHLDFLRDEEKAPTFGYRALLSSLEDVVDVDEGTLQLNLNTADVSFLVALGVNPGVPFSVAEVERAGDDELLKPVMTGPYTMQKFDIADDRVYARNDQYWQKASGGPPYLGTITLKAIPQQEARAASLESGDLDMILLSGDQTTIRLSENSNLQGRSYQGGGLMIYINATKAPFDDLRVRQAVAASIDKRKIVDTLYFGQGDESPSWIQPGQYGWSDYEPYPYDPAEARKFLESTGLELPVKIPYYYGGGGNTRFNEQMVSIYQESMRAAGFEVELKQMPTASDVQKAMFDELSLEIGTPFGIAARPDPGLTYQTFLASTARFNPAREADIPERGQIDDLLAQGKVEFDPEAREAIYHEVQKLARDAVYGQLPIAFAQGFTFASKKVGGFDHPDYTNSVGGGSLRPRYLWLEG